MPDQSFSGDRPWHDGQPDWFGLRPFASSVASSLLAGGPNAGLVVGIEGRWGSGKSSLLNMILDDLRSRAPDQRPITIEFRPWLVGDRDALLGSLFDDFSRAISAEHQAQGDSTDVTIQVARDVGKKLKQFAARLTGPGKLLSVLGAGGVPIAGALGVAMEKLAEASKEETAGPSLATLKDEITKSLTKLGKQIIITIDDVDRLEPAEVWEILRLIRAVADFPNVTYVLCYDEKVIAKSVRTIAKADGAAFLEKIVQVVIPVPSPEGFQLRHWFRSELGNFALTRTDDEFQRLLSVIDREGGRRLDTPRAVVRALNAIRLFWAPLQNVPADLPDLVWLQLVRIASPTYYKWIERYCDNYALIRSGRADLSIAQRKEEFRELQAIFDADKVDVKEELFFLDDILPGIDTFLGMDKDKVPIYANRGDGAAKSVDDKRLSSPDHYRLYFAMVQPEGAPTQADYDDLWAASDQSPQAFGQLILAWHRPGAVIGATKATNMLDRLAMRDVGSIASSRARTILLGIAAVADEAARRSGMNEFYGPEIWNASERLFDTLLPRIRDRERFIRLFFEGHALGWLTSLFRREYFDHGVAGERRRSESEWRLTGEELATVTQIMHRRYSRKTLPQFLSIPKPLSALFAWMQSGDSERPRQLVESGLGSDRSLLETLEQLTGRVMTSPGGEVITLSKANIGPFLDYDEARKRVEDISKRGKSPLTARAKKLAAAFEAGDRF